MIPGDIKPIGHISPYRRFDPNHPGRWSRRMAR
jgi:hypothetical protein